MRPVAQRIWRLICFVLKSAKNHMFFNLFPFSEFKQEDMQTRFLKIHYEWSSRVFLSHSPLPFSFTIAREMEFCKRQQPF